MSYKFDFCHISLGKVFQKAPEKCWTIKSSLKTLKKNPKVSKVNDSISRSCKPIQSERRIAIKNNVLEELQTKDCDWFGYSLFIMLYNNPNRHQKMIKFYRLYYQSINHFIYLFVFACGSFKALLPFIYITQYPWHVYLISHTFQYIFDRTLYNSFKLLEINFDLAQLKQAYIKL